MSNFAKKNKVLTYPCLNGETSFLESESFCLTEKLSLMLVFHWMGRCKVLRKEYHTIKKLQ